MAKPSEFYIGMIDFFAILLPGAIATALLVKPVGGCVLGPLMPVPASDAARWAAFLTCSYFLGHLIFLLGSQLDLLYDRWRTKFRPYGNESAYQRATAIRDAMIDEAEHDALNPFQWSRSVLLAVCPSAAEDVRRYEADSKFFRSLLVVFGLTAILFPAMGHPYAGLVSFGLMIPCVFRYAERRLKSTTQAYIHLITLHRLGLLAGKPGGENPDLKVPAIPG